VSGTGRPVRRASQARGGARLASMGWFQQPSAPPVRNMSEAPLQRESGTEGGRTDRRREHLLTGRQLLVALLVVECLDALLRRARDTDARAPYAPV